MNVLIVDDDDEKADDIAGAIVGLLPLHSLVKRAADLSEARRMLQNVKFDLLVLDVKIPQSSEGEARLDAGSDFISELRRARYLPIPPYCIIVTAHDEGMVNSDLPGMEGVYACIKYIPDQDLWRNQLASRVRYLAAVVSPDMSQAGQYDFDLAVVCALEDIELQAVLDLDWNWQAPTSPSGGDPSSYYFGSVVDSSGVSLRVVAVAAPQMGMAAMSVICMKLIHRFRPRHIIMPGIAAGVKKQASLDFGDILVADLSWDYGSGKLRIENGKPELAPDPRPIFLDPEIKAEFVELKKDVNLLASIKDGWHGRAPKSSLRVHIGPMASGASVIADETIVGDVLKQQRKLIGIEMEIYGLYYSAVNCSVPRPKVFALKSICDYGDREKSDKYQAYAAYTSARVMDAYVRRKLKSV